MNASVVYYSHFGNTKTIAETIAALGERVTRSVGNVTEP